MGQQGAGAALCGWDLAPRGSRTSRCSAPLPCPWQCRLLIPTAVETHRPAEGRFILPHTSRRLSLPRSQRPLILACMDFGQPLELGLDGGVSARTGVAPSLEHSAGIGTPGALRLFLPGVQVSSDAQSCGLPSVTEQRNTYAPRKTLGHLKRVPTSCQDGWMQPLREHLPRAMTAASGAKPPSPRGRRARQRAVGSRSWARLCLFAGSCARQLGSSGMPSPPCRAAPAPWWDQRCSGLAPASPILPLAGCRPRGEGE